MNIYKRLLSTVLITMLLLFVLQPVVRAVQEVTELGGARYYIEERKEANELPYGVMHYRDLAKSSTNAEEIVYASGWSADTTELFVKDQYYPQQVNVLEVPSNTNTKIVSWALLNNHKWSLATVRTLSMDYEAKNPGWKVIAAINGDFFDIRGNGNMPYQTIGAVTNDGENYRTTTNGVTNVGFTNDGSTNTLIGYKTLQRSDTMKLAIYDDQDEIIHTFNIEKVNEVPSVGETAAFFGTYNNEKNYVPINVSVGLSSGYFVDQAMLALPNTDTDFYGKGYVTSTNSKVLGIGQFAVLTNNATVNAALEIGVKIRVQWDIVGDYASATAISGAGQQFLDDGMYTNLVPHRHPRTVVGMKEDGTIVMMIVDGRQASRGMYGAQGSELAAMMSHYGVIEGYNLDGGGSSTLIVREGDTYVVKNSPSDGRERTDSNAILVVALDPEIQFSINNISQNRFTLEGSLGNLNGHPAVELFVEVEDTMYSLDNGPIVFENLTSNTSYVFNFYYKDEQENMIQVITQGAQRTYKQIPILVLLHVTETVDTFMLNVEYLDPDKATDFKTAFVGISGRTTTLWNGTSTINKSIIPEITNLYIRYYYNIGDGKNVLVQIQNPQYYSTMALYQFIQDQNQQVKSIYR